MNHVKIWIFESDIKGAGCSSGVVVENLQPGQIRYFEDLSEESARLNLEIMYPDIIFDDPIRLTITDESSKRKRARLTKEMAIAAILEHDKEKYIARIKEGLNLWVRLESDLEVNYWMMIITYSMKMSSNIIGYNNYTDYMLNRCADKALTFTMMSVPEYNNWRKVYLANMMNCGRSNSESQTVNDILDGKSDIYSWTEADARELCRKIDRTKHWAWQKD